MAKEKKIFRTKLTGNFVRIQNEILVNPNLSWKAKGLLCFMLSRKSDWEFHKVQVQKYSTDGRDGTISAFNELIKAGYVKQIKKRDSKGKFVSFDYFVYDTPFTENPFTDNPFTENPYLVTTQGSNTVPSKTKLSKTISSLQVNSTQENADSFYEKYTNGILNLDELSEIVKTL